MDNVVDLSRIWLIVRQNIGKMIVLGIVVGAVAFGVSKFVMHPQYQASTSLLVNRKQDNQNQNLQLGDQQADVQIINTYKDIITRPIILNKVVKNLTMGNKVQTKAAVPAKFDINAAGETVQVAPAVPAEYKVVPGKYTSDQLDEATIANSITITNQANSQVFSINVKTGDPVLAKDIANNVAQVFKQKVAAIMSVSNVSVVSKATTETAPVGPNVKLITLAGLLVGILIGFVWGLIKELTDRTVKSLDFLTEDLQLTNLGIINYIDKMRSVNDVIMEQNKNAVIDDSTRTQRSGRRI